MKAAYVNAVCATTLVVLVLLFCYSLITEDRGNANRCKMFYCYSPKFHLIYVSGPSNASYRLYRYIDKSNDRPRGIPVLFLPGTGGSHIYSKFTGSSLLHMRLREGLIFGFEYDSFEELERLAQSSMLNKFDVYAIDFLHEESFYSASILRCQIDFSVKCVNHILSLYGAEATESYTPPSSVLLYGFSMGGVVAKGIYTSPFYVPGTIRTIFTVNTPHDFSAFSILADTKRLVSAINRMWATQCRDEHSELSQVVIASFSSGFLDIQVPAAHTSLNAVHNCPYQYSAVTTSMYNVWSSTYHNMVVSCHQFQNALAFVIASMIDPQTRQIYHSAHKRFSVIKKLEPRIKRALRFEPRLPQRALDPLSQSELNGFFRGGLESAGYSPRIRQYTHFCPYLELFRGHSPAGGHASPRLVFPSPDPLDPALNFDLVQYLKSLSSTHEFTLAVGRRTDHLIKRWHLDDFPPGSLFVLHTNVVRPNILVLVVDETTNQLLNLDNQLVAIPYKFKQDHNHRRSWKLQRSYLLAFRTDDDRLKKLTGKKSLYVLTHQRYSKGISFSSNIYDEFPIYDSNPFLAAQVQSDSESLTWNVANPFRRVLKLDPYRILHNVTFPRLNPILVYKVELQRTGPPSGSYVESVNGSDATQSILSHIILYSPHLGEVRHSDSYVFLKYHANRHGLKHNDPLHPPAPPGEAPPSPRSTDPDHAPLRLVVLTDPRYTYQLAASISWVHTVSLVARNWALIVLNVFVFNSFVIFHHYRVLLTNRHCSPQTSPLGRDKCSRGPLLHVFDVVTYMLLNYHYYLFYVLLSVCMALYCSSYASNHHELSIQYPPTLTPHWTSFLVLLFILLATTWIHALFYSLFLFVLYQISNAACSISRLSRSALRRLFNLLSGALHLKPHLWQNRLSPLLALTGSAPESPDFVGCSLSKPNSAPHSSYRHPKTFALIFVALLVLNFYTHSIYALAACLLLSLFFHRRIPVFPPKPNSPQDNPAQVSLRTEAHMFFLFAQILCAVMPYLAHKSSILPYRESDSYKNLGLLSIIQTLLVTARKTHSDKKRELKTALNFAHLLLLALHCVFIFPTGSLFTFYGTLVIAILQEIGDVFEPKVELTKPTPLPPSFC
ncbi:uncharacterized protein LOC126315336 [Schistocerca gregaria]|uniref:uncharacterized protein LOC126315336 n=1 Tax=Schistocerca gregaria TaxID=7010 RepID=UPI00211E3CB8|nr:uncharacterized protein LOC126315336 [Schistocerca gregaria]